MNAIARAVEDAKSQVADDGAWSAADLHDVMTNMAAPVRYIIDPIIPRGEVTLLGAHGGSGKTILALTLALHAACGRRWGPFESITSNVAYFSLEDPLRRIRSRLRRIIETYSLPAATALAGLRVYDRSDVDATLAVDVLDAGRHILTPTGYLERLDEAAGDADLIVIDNASDGYGGNENDRREVRTFIRLLASMARKHDAAVLLLAHIDKAAARYGGAGNTYSGSTAWHNSVRSRLALVDDDHGLLLANEKNQDAKLADPVRVAFNEQGVLVPQDAHAVEDVAAHQAEIDATAVLTVLRIALESGAVITTAKRGSATAWHTLCDYPELADEYKAKGGQRRVTAALVRLERAGKIVKVPYKKPNRHDGESYKLAQTASACAPESARATPPIPPCVTGARAERAPVPQSASISTGAKLAQPTDWLANADPEIRAKLAGFREQGARP